MSFELICLIYVAGLAILFTELFIPGLVIGFIGSAVVVTSIYFAFTELDSPIYGTSLIVISLIIIPTILSWGLKRVTLNEEQSVGSGYTSCQDGIQELVGKEGITKSMLRPSGIVQIENKRFDVVSQGQAIEKDVKVKVVKVEGNQIFVRSVT